jgi:hypothetical protein
MTNVGPNIKLGVPMFIAAFILGAVLLYGGATLIPAKESAAEGDAPIPTGPVTMTVVGRNLAFNVKTISAGVGVPVTITLDNQDAGVLHNIAFYTNRSASTAIANAKGELFTGPGQQTLNFTAPPAGGNYFFRCDAHPDTMNGTFRVQ